MSDQEPTPRINIEDFRNSFIGIGALTCSAFLIFGAWPLYGAAGALPLSAAWIVSLFLATRWFTPAPNRVLALGVVSIALWALVAWLAQ